MIGRADGDGMDISEVLNRRSDLSTFVIHFTRDRGDGRTARDNLESILQDLTIRAVTPMGWIKDVPRDQLAEAKVVCFSETPLEHANLLVRKIKWRQIELSPYGIAFTKEVARRKGINPVWYVDMTPGQDARWAIRDGLEDLKEAAVSSPGGFASHTATKVLPFIEQMGTWTSSKKEFWWEREWRHRGDLTFSLWDATLALCPEADIDEIEQWGLPAVDPFWSLEEMVRRLATSEVGSHADRRARRRERLRRDDEAANGRDA